MVYIAAQLFRVTPARCVSAFASAAGPLTAPCPSATLWRRPLPPDVVVYVHHEVLEQDGMVAAVTESDLPDRCPERKRRLQALSRVSSWTVRLEIGFAPVPGPEQGPDRALRGYHRPGISHPRSRIADRLLGMDRFGVDSNPRRFVESVPTT